MKPDADRKFLVVTFIFPTNKQHHINGQCIGGQIVRSWQVELVG